MATPTAELSSLLSWKSAILTREARGFNVIYVSDATGIAHYWQKTCPKGLWTANNY
jgi:hypothetical protein